MIVHRLLITEYLHTDRTVGELLIGVPGVEVGHQVVFFVKIQVANKTFKLGFLFVMSLDVSKEEISLREFFIAFWTD